MAVSVFKTFAGGEVLTASDLNSSFAKIVDNGQDLAWPATASKDLSGETLILDDAGTSSIDAQTDGLIRIKTAGSTAFTISAQTPIDLLLPATSGGSHVFDLQSANSLQTGGIFRGTSGSTDTGTRSLLRISSSSSLATGCTIATFTQAAAKEVMVLDQNATAAGSSFVDYQGTIASNATGPISDLTTTGTATHHIQIELNGTKAWIPCSTTDPS